MKVLPVCPQTLPEAHVGTRRRRQEWRMGVPNGLGGRWKETAALDRWARLDQRLRDVRAGTS